MSEKRAKEERRNEQERKPIATVKIDVFDDMDVNVREFPSDHAMAMMVLCNALVKVSDYFVRGLHVQKQSDILLARPRVSPDDIIKMSKGN